MSDQEQEAAVTPPEPTLTELGNRASAFYAIAERFKELSAVATADLRHAMLTQYKNTRVKPTVETELATGEGEAQELVTGWIIPKTNPTVSIANTDTFIAHCEEHYPSEVEWVPVVKTTFEKALLKRAVRVGKTAAMVDPTNGLVIEGLKYVPAAEPSSIRSQWPDGAKERLLEYLGPDSLQELIGAGMALPAGTKDGDQVEEGQA